MDTIVRQQMVCIIAPDWPRDADLPDTHAELKAALDELLSDVCIVHFTSMALLPPIKQDPAQLPSLMIELAVEEGLQPYDLLTRLVTHPSGAMWRLFQVYWPEAERSMPVGQRNQQLLARLMSWHNIADGAFVGVRDRSLRQIEKEKGLLRETRLAARSLKAANGQERAPFAQALARWAFANPAFEWAMEPAPRSFWRAGGASLSAKLGLVAALVCLWLGSLWLIGALARGAARIDAWLFDRSSSIVQSLFGAVSDVFGYLLGASERSLLVLAVFVIAAVVILGVLPALIEPWRRWLQSMRRELDRPTDTWSSRATYAVLRFVGVPLLALAFVHAVAFVVYPHLFDAIVAIWLPWLPAWQTLALAFVALVIVVALLGMLDRLMPQATAWFFRPHEDDVPRAQQVHPSIEACEAKVVTQTGHMISLTDIRQPSGWSAGCIRFVLRLVTVAARIFSTEGRLGDAPGIHFGHWHIIDGGRRLLFCSNFDGNFGGYLDDFINGASVGTTLAWRWTELHRRNAARGSEPAVVEPRAFPPTRFVAFRGVKCELKFKSYARDSMIPHVYRFDAARLTIDQINRATRLRDALFGKRSNSTDEQIMRAVE